MNTPSLPRRHAPSVPEAVEAAMLEFAMAAYRHGIQLGRYGFTGPRDITQASEAAWDALEAAIATAIREAAAIAVAKARYPIVRAWPTVEDKPHDAA